MKLTLRRPDDLHLHLRDGAMLATVLGHTVRQFARAIVMPNLRPPVVATELALAYRERIRAALPAGARFEPLMTLYLTDRTAPEEIERARASGAVHAVKYYPAGATTNSDSGVTDLRHTYAVLERLEALGMPLLLHGELTGDCDPFDRERLFIERELAPLVKRFARLKIVFEHATTREAVDFVRAHAGLAATLTPQHLLLNRGALFAGGLRPHLYCLPLLKREADREALLAAATSGSPQFFLGTDSAPHSRASKEQAACCAGIYSAHAALELYAEAFASVGALHRLEDFASRFGADFYGLPLNEGTLTLEQVPWTVPADYPFGAERLVPWRAGETLAWRLAAGAP
jgi:dihydroorotase